MAKIFKLYGLFNYALLAMAFIPGAQAQTQWDFSGFASIGAGHLNRDDITFLDYTDDWSFDSDSMLGMQMIVAPMDRFSITTQVVARGFSFVNDDSYDPRLEWFFASYELTPEWRMRVGRLRTPHYLFSESLEIGYSYPWVRPPNDMYVSFLEPFSHFYGADLTWQHAFGSVDSDFKILYGKTSGKFSGIDIDVNKTYGVATKARWNDFTLRYALNVNQVNLTLPQAEQATQYFTLASNVNPVFSGLDRFFYDDERLFKYHGLGFQWEHDNWNFTAERFLFQGPQKQFSFNSDGWYLSLGWQWRKWMPYGVLGQYQAKMDPDMVNQFRQTYTAYPYNPADSISQLIEVVRTTAISELSKRNARQHTQTLGIRYDFYTNMDLKLELQRFEFFDHTTGQIFSQTTPDKNPGSAVLTTLVLDVVF